MRYFSTLGNTSEILGYLEHHGTTWYGTPQYTSKLAGHLERLVTHLLRKRMFGFTSDNKTIPCQS